MLFSLVIIMVEAGDQVGVGGLRRIGRAIDKVKSGDRGDTLKYIGSDPLYFPSLPVNS